MTLRFVLELKGKKVLREKVHLPLLVVRKPLSFSGESIPRVSCSRTSLNRRRDGVRNTKPPWGSNPPDSSTRGSTSGDAHHTNDHLLRPSPPIQDAPTSFFTLYIDTKTDFFFCN
ncbi:uncharacterized protein TNIN_320781 [Trichonephila inaurata madagascariensis]|uniref:Uncharacterized protein n=1 Tax=Trichonephila inaurata madagascariensis TaxID=2747483 RepID=A0A8X6Y232_9ARAC|nr:uncharacterized protein TNIN_320781 [Trichonephila inaurata madagascariensis]